MLNKMLHTYYLRFTSTIHILLNGLSFHYCAWLNCFTSLHSSRCHLFS